MNPKIENGFGIGKLSNLTWSEIESYAAELSRDEGDVTYCGHYLCTVYNDDAGGNIEDAEGNHMTDDKLQQAIDAIDQQ